MLCLSNLCSSCINEDKDFNEIRITLVTLIGCLVLVNSTIDKDFKENKVLSTHTTLLDD